MSKLEDALTGLTQAVFALTKAAHADDKTPLLNALAFRKHAQDALSNIERPVVLVFGDINQFKAVNEQHSHIAGDAAINRVGTLLQEISDKCGAQAYRQSGDEFVLLLPEDQVETFRAAVNERLTSASVTYLSNTFEVGVSFGYAHAEDGELHDLLKRAEDACSLAKGQNGSVVKWTADISDGLPTNMRRRCTHCDTKFDCWIPKGRLRGLWCPGCGEAITLPNGGQGAP